MRVNIYILKSEDIIVEWNCLVSIYVLGEISSKGNIWIDEDSGFLLVIIFRNYE